MQIDRAAFMAAFERVAARLARPPYNYAIKGDRYESIPFLRKHKYADLPGTFEELIEQSIEDEAIANFITLLIAREVSPALTKVTSKDVHVVSKRGSRFTLFAGDLEIHGNFGYEHTVLVLGDLTVHGLIEDRFEASPLLVAGNVRAKGLYIGSETRIGGSLDVSELLHLRFTRGGKTLFVERGARAKLYLFTPHDSSFVGTLDVKYMLQSYPERADPALVKLRTMLSPYLARKLDADDPDLTHLSKALRDGRSLWR
jgi:hypothetical protein